MKFVKKNKKNYQDILDMFTIGQNIGNSLRIYQDIDKNVQFWCKHRGCYPLL